MLLRGWRFFTLLLAALALTMTSAHVLELPQNPREPSEFEAGNVTLAIWRPEDQGVEFESGASHGIALRVADVAAARAELEAKGVEFVGERDSGVCDMAFFEDPDGNSLILHRRYAP